MNSIGHTAPTSLGVISFHQDQSATLNPIPLSWLMKQTNLVQELYLDRFRLSMHVLCKDISKYVYIYIYIDMLHEWEYVTTLSYIYPQWCSFFGGPFSISTSTYPMTRDAASSFRDSLSSSCASCLWKNLKDKLKNWNPDHDSQYIEVTTTKV